MSKPNHLIHEASPYLQQHAYHPVDWYPWGQEALEKAKRENKPIFLSIGYTACHWCHVMAHESFEDEETAKIMNELFINIKVDREERPDLDKIYQSTHYLLTRRGGGWPLTVFLTPDDRTPFFSGTYYPREPRYHLPGFKDVLKAIGEIYQHRHTEVKDQNAELLKLLEHEQPTISDLRLSKQPIQLAMGLLSQSYDSVHGGFGHAPKFPQAPKLEFLLSNNSPMAANTLQCMARGGINDQLSGGFYRYTVDADWHIPHFEKMLYDNGQLLSLYTIAAKQLADAHLAETARATANWVLTNMQSPDGGYFSSMDADSEGHEGKYYVWDAYEIESILDRDEYYIVRLYYGLDQPPNFEKHWHLYVNQSIESIAADLNISLEQATATLNSAKQKLLAVRSKRIPPATDEKILTSWNSLMIKGLLLAGDHLYEPRFTASAKRALAFIRKNMWHDKRLYACHKDGKSYLAGYLDDYAFLCDALITSLQTAWDSEELAFAIELANSILQFFPDKIEGGFYFTAEDHEKLLYRPKSMMDETIPSGNGIALRCFLTLGHLLGDTRYLAAAEKILHAAWTLMSQYPAEHCSLLIGLQAFLAPPEIIIIRGSEKEGDVWKKASQSANNHVFLIPNDAVLSGSLAEKAAQQTTCAYVCQGTQCSAVITDLASLLEKRVS